MRPIRFNHLSISARNLGESPSFYEEMFGLERIPTYNFGFKTQYLRCGRQQLHIFELEDAVPVRQHFALDVDDFEARGPHDRGRLAGHHDPRPERFS
jgi:Glyoxalase/Bleomycin resistance protein/Dioxygenase superfamily